MAAWPRSDALLSFCVLLLLFEASNVLLWCHTACRPCYVIRSFTFSILQDSSRCGEVSDHTITRATHPDFSTLFLNAEPFEIFSSNSSRGWRKQETSWRTLQCLANSIYSASDIRDGGGMEEGRERETRTKLHINN